MRSYLFTSCVFIACHTLQATTYYVSNDGIDSNIGTSPTSPWETLDKVNNYFFVPSDSILFKRDDIWRGQLNPQSGNINGYIYYGAYGSGDKPVIMGSWNITETKYWVNIGGNIWSTVFAIPLDVGNIILDNESSFGVKKWSESELLQQGDYWYDTLNNKLQLFSNSNPASFYNNIECALAYNIIHQENKSYIIYENLALKYGSGHGVGGGNTDNIIIRSCDISYIGGGANYHPAHGWVRYGNGIEFWGNASNNLVEKCKLWEIYDAALTNQNEGNTAIQTNIIYRNNLIYNAEWSFEYWNRPGGSLTQDIYFLNNTCLYAGNTWAHAQRPDKRGRHLNFFQIDAETSDFYIMNNVFYEASSAGLYVLRYSDLDSLTLDYNAWYQTLTDTLIDIKWGTATINAYSMSEFADYQNTYQQDLNAIVQHPEFVDVNNEDYQLLYTSPCVNSGTPDTTGIPVGEYDFNGNPRIQGDPLRIDIGCIESGHSTGLIIIDNSMDNSDEITIYPNPFTNAITIQTRKRFHKTNLNIYNVLGQSVMQISNISGNATKLYRDNLPTGLYIFRLTEENKVIYVGKAIVAE